MITRVSVALWGAALGILGTATFFLLVQPNWPGFTNRSPPVVAREEEKAAHDSHPGADETASVTDHTSHADDDIVSPNAVLISPERLQSIGVRFEPAARRPLNHVIRTVGRVEVDERRLSRVTIKLEGWIDRLFVNYTGELVAKGQELFSLYSPELLATQEEYLLALRSSRTLGKSEFPEVANGAKALLAASRRRLLLWDIKQNHIEDLELTGEVLTTLPIHAPQGGTVIHMMAVAGMHIKPGDELYTIADLSRVWILGDIYEYEMPLVAVGQSAVVKLSFAPDVTMKADIDFIYPTVDPQTRTVKVRFALENPGERLKPGMYTTLELEIPLGVRLVVPRSAVLESGERQIIFIHLGGGRLEWRNATIGQRSGDWVEVVDGLEEGEHVVTSANFLIDSESQLKAAIGGMAGMKH